MNSSRTPGAGLRLTFPRERRILKRADFSRIYRSGRKIEGRYVTLFGVRREAAEGGVAPWRLGITATRKAGPATQRNRQRRLVRTYFRLNQHWIPEGWDFVVNTKALLSGATIWNLTEDLDRILTRLGFPPKRVDAPADTPPPPAPNRENAP